MYKRNFGLLWNRWIYTKNAEKHLPLLVFVDKIQLQ